MGDNLRTKGNDLQFPIHAEGFGEREGWRKRETEKEKERGRETDMLFIFSRHALTDSEFQSHSLHKGKED